MGGVVMKLLSIFLIFVFLLSYTTCAQEKKNPLEGTAWELISAEYFENNSIVPFPATKYDKSIIIWGKSNTVGVWQDSSRTQASYFVGHKYNIEGDSITFNINFFYPEKNQIGKSFKVKFEIVANQLRIEGFSLGSEKQHKYHEVWKRID